MTYFLDTNICIYALKGRYPRIEEEIRRRRPSQIRIPSIVRAELQFGVRKSDRPEENHEAIETFLAPFDVVPFDEKASVAYADIRAELEEDGRPIGPNDLIIAATVGSRRGVLVTHNRKEFEQVPSLDITDWTDET